MRNNSLRRALPGLALLIFLLACGGQRTSWNNQIRRAVFEYAYPRYGPVDDLILAFERSEPRIKFERQHQAGGRTIWLDRFGAREFFALRPAEATFLYIRNIRYNDDYTTATVELYYGQGNGTEREGWLFTLRPDENGQWQVVSEESLDK